MEKGNDLPLRSKRAGRVYQFEFLQYQGYEMLPIAYKWPVDAIRTARGRRTEVEDLVQV